MKKRGGRIPFPPLVAKHDGYRLRCRCVVYYQVTGFFQFINNVSYLFGITLRTFFIMAFIIVLVLTFIGPQMQAE